MAYTSGTSPVCLVIWSVSFVWLNKTNSMNKTNQMNQINQINKANQSNQMTGNRGRACPLFFYPPAASYNLVAQAWGSATMME
jgi:hypothetical protein